MTRSIATSDLVAPLRRVLQHLYDPAELRRSPLPGLLGIAEPVDRVSFLRNLLQKAILALAPAADVPANANSRRYYELLTYRFIEQSSQREVAADMALSMRHLQRLEAAALQLLAEQLAAQHGVLLVGRVEVVDESAFAKPSPEFQQEIDFLQKTYQLEPVILANLVSDVAITLQPLLAAQRVSLTMALADELPPVWAQEIPLQQALLHVLSLLAQLFPGGVITVNGRAQEQQVWLTVTAEDTPPLTRHSQPPELEAGLPLVNQLLGGSQAGFETSWQGGVFQAVFCLKGRALRQVTAVDDNQDALQLFERYLAGTQYRFVGTSEPDRVLELLTEQETAVLILDVMLPHTDGWSLLAQIRQHPVGQTLRIIISTILPQERLALMLGADAFLRKPFTKEQLLALLDKLLEPSN
jgi:CheY-like chemotaxis protein